MFINNEIASKKYKDFFNIDKNREYWEYLYLDYINNFLTIDKFAEHWHLSDYQANKLISFFRNNKRLNK